LAKQVFRGLKHIVSEPDLCLDLFLGWQVRVDIIDG